MGRTTSSGRWLCADRSGAETARGPGDLGYAPTEAEIEPLGSSDAPAPTKKQSIILILCFLFDAGDGT